MIAKLMAAVSGKPLFAIFRADPDYPLFAARPAVAPYHLRHNSDIENAIAGTLTDKSRELKGGGTAVYHQLQRWKDGRNVTVHVPADKVEAMRAGIVGRARPEALLQDLADADTEAALAGCDPDKKKRRRPSGASRGGSPGSLPPRSTC